MVSSYNHQNSQPRSIHIKKLHAPLLLLERKKKVAHCRVFLKAETSLGDNSRKKAKTEPNNIFVR
jgi:hypothetical protein